MISYKNNKQNYIKNNSTRVFKLYINYWIILLLFVVIMGPIMEKSEIYPGNLKSFILTFTGIDLAYNGAWWFFTTYIILVLVSPIINNLVVKNNNVILIGLSFVFYGIAYIQRIKGILIFENEILNWAIRQAALFGTSQLPFIVGAVFSYKEIYSKLYNIVNKIKYKNLLGILIIVLMIVVHGFIETLFVAVFTGIVFICVFNLIDKPKWVDKLFYFLGDHSTNIWLIHMFFYMIYFKKLVYGVKYSFLIFPWLIILSLISSYIVKFIYRYIIKLLEQSINMNSFYINKN